MTAEQLAAKISAAGLRYTRAQVTNLELGNREAVGVGELLILARVLGVPPLLLITPVGHVDVVEPLPGVEVHTWAAAKWITGEAPWPTYDADDQGYYTTPEDFKNWQKAGLDLFRQHDLLIQEWELATGLLMKAGAELAHDGPMPPRPGREGWQQQREVAQVRIAAAEHQLRRTRSHMRDDGLTPPELGPGLQHLDVKDEAQAAAEVRP